MQTVLVTGASSGIGRATALAFARSGDRLILSSRSREALYEVAAECRALGAVNVHVAVADVTRPEDVEAAVVEPVDVWVHTAAVMAYGKFEDVPGDVFNRVIETDLIGASNVARVALHHFRGRGRGVLIIGGSLLGTVVTPYTSSYVVSKWGVRALIRALRIETRDAPDIHVCVVSPGAVDTPIYRTAANYAGRFGQPPPPVDTPEKVAKAIVRCARRPRGTVTVGVANKIIQLGYVVTPALYDVLVGPLMRVGGLSRDEVAPHDGNVFEPMPGADAVHGGNRQPWRTAPGIAAGMAAVAGAVTAGALLTRRRSRG